MQLATRITLFACLALATLAGVLLLAGMQREQLAEERFVGARIQGDQVIWNMLVERKQRALQRAVDDQAQSLANLARSASEGDRGAAVAGLQSVLSRLRETTPVDFADIVGPTGALMATTSPDAQPVPLLDAGLREQVLRTGQTVGGLQLDAQRRFQLATAIALRHRGAVVGMITVAAAIDPQLAEMSRSVGAQTFLLSLRGRLLHGTDHALWQAIAVADEVTSAPMTVRHRGDRAFLVIKSSVEDATGRVAAALVTAHDETESLARDARFTVLIVSGVVAGVAATLVLLYLFLSNNFRPLHGAINVLNALSRGDTSVRIEARQASDEIGRIAQAVHLFRDFLITLQDLRDQQNRMRRRQERFIRQQMQALADTLDEKPRMEVMRDLDEIVASTRNATPGTKQEDDQLGLLAVVLKQMSERVHEQQKVRDTFGKYIDPRIVETLIDQPSLGGERRIMSVAFTDLQGFTSLSEQTIPTTLVSLLNEYLTLMSEAIFSSSGIVDKYIGDAVMAFWGPPFIGERDHAIAACRAALEQRVMIEEFRKRVPAVLGRQISGKGIDIRCGIASGELVVGSVGSERTRNFTVLGDTVNIAARLEGANKAYGTRILISEQTRLLAGEAIITREVDLVGVVGRQEPVRIYELTAMAGQASPEALEIIDRYERALGLYRTRDWDGAGAELEGLLDSYPQDGPAKMLLLRIEHLREAPPPDNWRGEWRLLDK